MSTTKTARLLTSAPAAKRPAHRPPLPEDQRTIVFSVRLTPADRAKFDALGGVGWLRGVLAKARVPATIEQLP